MSKISLKGLQAALTKLSTHVIIMLITVGIIAFIGVFILQSVRIKEMQFQYQQKQAELAAIQERNDRLQQHLDFYSSPGYMLYVEKVAREALGMARPGETVILVVPDASPNPSSTQTATANTTAPPESTPIPAAKRPSWQNWFNFFFR